MDRAELEALAWLNRRRDRLGLEALDAWPPRLADVSPLQAAWALFPAVEDPVVRFGQLRWWTPSGTYTILPLPAAVLDAGLT